MADKLEPKGTPSCARPLARLLGACRLLAVVALTMTASGCAVALAGKPEPYAGSLHEGLLVRAILERGSPPFGEIHATRRVGRDTAEVEIVTFSRAPRWRPDAGGTMVVFRVVGSSTYHTPENADGMHEWLSVYECELVDVELSEDEAIAAARSCLAGRAEAAAYDREDPFAFGPGTAGGWTVRFDPVEAGSASAITLELDRRGRCIESSPAAPPISGPAPQS